MISSKVRRLCERTCNTLFRKPHSAPANNTAHDRDARVAKHTRHCAQYIQGTARLDQGARRGPERSGATVGPEGETLLGIAANRLLLPIAGFVQVNAADLQAALLRKANVSDVNRSLSVRRPRTPIVCQAQVRPRTCAQLASSVHQRLHASEYRRSRTSSIRRSTGQPWPT